MNTIVLSADSAFRGANLPSMSASRTCSSRSFIMSRERPGSQNSGTEFDLPLAPRVVSVALLFHRYCLSKDGIICFPLFMPTFSVIFYVLVPPGASPFVYFKGYCASRPHFYVRFVIAPSCFHRTGGI